MNFAQQQNDPRRRIIGFGAVLLFHLLIVYALVSGLAKKVVDVVRAPIETKVIEEIKKPPPPPRSSASRSITRSATRSRSSTAPSPASTASWKNWTSTAPA